MVQHAGIVRQLLALPKIRTQRDYSADAPSFVPETGRIKITDTFWPGADGRSSIQIQMLHEIATNQIMGVSKPTRLDAIGRQQNASVLNPACGENKYTST